MKEQERVSFFKTAQIHFKILLKCRFGRTISVKQNGLKERVSIRWVNHTIFLLKCNNVFFKIGNHYWYDNHLNKNCSEFLPGFVMYNKRQLSAFGWSISNKLDFSRRIEFPPKAAILVRLLLFLTLHV
jgi:hypothetical protein